jgi:hypothetical protein
MIRFAAVVTLFAIIGFLASSCRHEDRPLNESLRLTDAQIVTDKQRAQSGDRDAAKRLWRHYNSVMLDYDEGEKWHKIYNELPEHESASPASGSVTRSPH